ncbi:MAG: sugar phosphate isomerase/epimerase [Ruminococcaceae bacterium]|nr:sugar phosphate isomerase/epimerase [Oscillospiraceae bacterium]
MAKFLLSAFADEAGSTLDEQIAALKDNQIDYIEPRNIDKKGILTLTDEELYEVKRKLDANGIKVNSLGSPIGKYNIEDEFEPHLELTKRAIRVCEILGTKNMRMFSFFTEQSDLKKNRDEVIRRLKVMTEEAVAHGITLCHENESRIYGQMPEEVRDVLTEVEGLGGIFDAANYRMNDADVDAGIEATLINFKYMHIKDAIFESQTIVPAGEGEGKIGEIIDIVNEKVDGEVYLTLEPHLHVFDAYKDIDDHELKGKYSFKSNREAFDFATNALKSLLMKHGYKRNGNNEWIK